MFLAPLIVLWCFSLNLQHPDPQDLQLNVTGFLNGKNARMFMQELWDLFISAQQNVGGIPSKFLDQKKEEIRLKKVN